MKYVVLVIAEQAGILLYWHSSSIILYYLE